MITDRQIELIVGALLHDIGKVVYRSGDGRDHSVSGYEYLRGLENNFREKKLPGEVLDCVRYHHGKHLKNAAIQDDSLAYITYFADNVAAFSDRRQMAGGEDGFDKKIPLDSVFNILNGNNGKQHYAMRFLNPDEDINYPTEDKVEMDEGFYNKVVADITDNLKGIELSREYVDSLLSVLEANLTYIPSSTSKRELADISLYDHVKMTAAIASCIEQYLAAEGEQDYRTFLYKNAEKNYDTKMFMLYSMDISGIQNFIYTIGESGALKGLRARSFYLEILMEHIIDELLEKLSLSRANLIYTGGGHCFILLPNTKNVLKTIDQYEVSVNEWLMDKFGTALYIGTGYAVANANAFRNMPDGSYSDLYRNISRMISRKKTHRYDAAQIIKLNSQRHEGERECKICRRIAILNEVFAGKPDDDNECLLALFGSAKKGAVKTSRVLFSDMFLSNMDELKRGGLTRATEVKFENSISRASAVANPRQIERVVRGAKFPVQIIYEVSEGAGNADKAAILQDIKILKDGFVMLEYDYLGGSGSRGYGRVKFDEFGVECVLGELDDDIIDECQKIMEG